MQNKDIQYFTGHGRIEYNTPQWLYESLDKEFGFTVDGAASANNAKCKKFWTIEDNSLLKDWTDEVVFLNPPYGKGVTSQWVKKAYYESKKGATVAMVVPVRADAKWWHDYAMKAEVRLFRNRLNFDNTHGAVHYAPFATAILVFRPYQHALVSLPEIQKTRPQNAVETGQNIGQHTQVEMPNLCNVCESRGVSDCDLKQGSVACWAWLVRHFNRA